MKFTAKFGLAIGLAAVVAIVIAPMAMAGVVGSNHDMTFKYTGQMKSGACSHCHIPHKAGGAKLWAITVTQGTTGWQSETISQLCYTCHGTLTYTGAREENPFGATNKHARSVANLTSFLPAPDVTALPAEVAAVLSSDTDLKCTTCHDVHSNDHRPFIRWETAVGYQFGEHCKKCHLRRANSNTTGTPMRGTNNYSVNGYSQHPTETQLANTTRAAFIPSNADFNQNPGAVGIAVSNFNLGGHRSEGTAVFIGGNMTCSTCHAVHGNETDVYSAADGSSIVTSANLGYNHLTVRSTEPTATAPFVAPICIGCHFNTMDAAGVGAGPGLQTTTSYSHPIGTQRINWVFPTLDTSVGYKWGGANDAIVCQSCHDIHYGQPRTSLLYGTIDAPSTTSNRNCLNCHTFGTMVHHPTDVVPPAAMVTAWTKSTAPIAWGPPLVRTTAGNVPYTTFTNPLGGSNIIKCATCHYQTGAHNNTGPFNDLQVSFPNSEICVDCHSFNPSVHTTVYSGFSSAVPNSNITANASHYIGNIATPGYRRTSAWPTTGYSSKYATTGTGLNATTGAIICQSCHTLKMTGGNGTGPTITLNDAHANHVRASVSLMIETAGNRSEDYAPAADLCTGCHGAQPAGGSGTTSGGTQTHPTVSNNMTPIGDAVLSAKITATWTAQGSVSKTAGGLLSCESCHRPHDAANGSGALILEGAGSASNKFSGTGTLIFDRTGYNGTGGNAGLRYTEEATFCNMCHNY